MQHWCGVADTVVVAHLQPVTVPLYSFRHRRPSIQVYRRTPQEFTYIPTSIPKTWSPGLLVLIPQAKGADRDI